MINDIFPRPTIAAVQAVPAYLDRDAGIKFSSWVHVMPVALFLCGIALGTMAF